MTRRPVRSLGLALVVAPIAAAGAARPCPAPADRGARRRHRRRRSASGGRGLPDGAARGAAGRRDADGDDRDRATGSMTIKVEADLSPIAAGNFVALAGCGYYDGVVFHRVGSLGRHGS